MEIEDRIRRLEHAQVKIAGLLIATAIFDCVLFACVVYLFNRP